MSEEQTETTNTEEQPAAIATPSLFQNTISYIGFLIAAASFTSILLLILLASFSTHDNPYADLVIYIFVPSILGFGLFVAVVGALIERRRRKRSKPGEFTAYPVIDLNNPRRRRSFVAFILLAFA